MCQACSWGQWASHYVLLLRLSPACLWEAGGWQLMIPFDLSHKATHVEQKTGTKEQLQSSVYRGWVGCCDICLYTSEVYEGHALTFRISAFYYFYFTGHHGNTAQVFLFKFALYGASGQLCGLRAHTMWLRYYKVRSGMCCMSSPASSLNLSSLIIQNQLANKGRHKKKKKENQSLICLVQYFHYEQGA